MSGFVFGALVIAALGLVFQGDSLKESVVRGLTFAAFMVVVHGVGVIAARLGWFPKPGQVDADDAAVLAQLGKPRHTPPPVGLEIGWLPAFVGPAVSLIFLASALQDGDEFEAALWAAFGVAWLVGCSAIKRAWRKRRGSLEKASS